MTNPGCFKCDRAGCPPRVRHSFSTGILAILATVLLAGLVGHQCSEASTATITAEAEGVISSPIGSYPDNARIDGAVLYPNRVVEQLDQRSQLSSLTDDIHEVMFIDPSIGDLETLLRGLRPSIETLILDPARDGVRQMTQALRHRRGVQAIHILSHGRPGTLALGAGALHVNLLDARTREFAAVFGAALAEDGDILIYGCNFGAGRTGRLAVQALAHATGADVTASDDLTGNPALGGDWDLEVVEGDVSGGSAVALAESFARILQNDNSEYTPINIRVGVYTNTLTFVWDIAHPDGRVMYHDNFRLEYREFGSGDAFQHGGSTTQTRANTFIENVGYIDGLEPDTTYEVRIRWQSTPEGLSHSPWGTVTAKTLLPLDVNLQTARTVAGQDIERRLMTATWDNIPVRGTQFLLLRDKGSEEPISSEDFDTVDYHDETRDQILAKAVWLERDAEYEARVVAVYTCILSLKMRVQLPARTAVLVFLILVPQTMRSTSPNGFL